MVENTSSLTYHGPLLLSHHLSAILDPRFVQVGLRDPRFQPSASFPHILAPKSPQVIGIADMPFALFIFFHFLYLA